MTTSRFVAANGLRLHYLEAGSGTTTLVLLPGLTANAHSFDGLLAAGLTDELHVLAFDARGRGRSDKPDSGYTIADHADDLVASLDVLGLERVVLAGHSFGGLLTYYTAAHHPDRVAKAVVLDAPVELDPAILDQIAPSLARLERTYASWDEYDAHARSLPYWDDIAWSDEIQAYYRGDAEELPDGAVRAHCRPEHIQAVIEGEFDVDWPATLTRVACPTLVVRATQPFGPRGSGPILEAESARRAVATLRDARLVEIDGNHLTFLFGTPARRVVDAIESFVGA